MTKKYEELVGQIAIALEAAYRRGWMDKETNTWAGKHGGWGWARKRGKRLITLTLSAVRDGLEIPGEEARIKDCYISELGGCRDIIALTGTSQGDPAGGKEEE